MSIWTPEDQEVLDAFDEWIKDHDPVDSGIEDLREKVAHRRAQKQAMIKANQMIESWTLEELKSFAFDRLTDELMEKEK